MTRTAAGRRNRHLAHRTLARSCSPVIESLEPRQLLSATSSVDLISVASDGSASAAASGSPSVSADGKRIVFTSTAALVPGVTANGQEMVYLRNIADNTTTLISKASDGSRPDAPALEPKISGDGNFVVYSSAADNLAVGDANGHADVFLYNITTQATTIVSTGSGGTAADGDSSAPTISSDGKVVAFISAADNLVAADGNGVADAFKVDITSGTVTAVTRVSTAADGTEADAATTGAVLSGDGKFVAFLSAATNLVASDTNGVADVFLRDVAAGTTIRLSVSSSGAEANGASGRIAINKTGTVVAFESDATNLVPGDTNGVTDIFLRNVTTSKTTRISVGAANTQADGASTNPSISDDGLSVAYTSAATNLVLADTNGKSDVFLYDNSSNRRIGGANDAPGNGDSSQPAISGDGNFIAFASDATNLVTGDANGFADVFLKDLVAAPHATASGTPDGNNPTDIPAGDTTPVTADGTDFGIVDVATAGGVTHTFTITNTGVDRLVFSGTPLVRVSGASASDFTVTLPDPFYPGGKTGIDPGESVTFTVTFDPSSPGIRTATITFTSNDPAHPTYTFAVSGVATDASIVSRMIVTQGTTPVPTGTGGTPFSFGTIRKNAAEKTLVFTVMNVSAQTITLDPASLSLATGFEVTVNFDPSDPHQSVTIAPGHTATFALGMKTATAGDTSATVNLSNTVSGADARSTTFAVTGSVVSLPKINVLVGAAAVTTGQTITYGSVVIDSASPTKIFTIKNDGTDTLTISVPALPDGYKFLAAVPTTILPGKSIAFTVALETTSAAGTKNGPLSFTTNDPDVPSFTINLTGAVIFASTPNAVFFVNGTPVAGRSISFGTLRQRRAPALRTVTVRNDGTPNLVLGKITLPAGYSLWSAPGATTLASGASTTFTVAFRPLAAGTQTGVLSVVTNESAGAASSGITATVTPTAKKGLSVDAVAVNNLPKSVIVGGTGVAATAAVTLFNHASSALSGTYKVTLYAAAGPFARPGADKVLGSATLHLNLPAYGKTTRAVHISFPSPPANKRYGIFAVVTGHKVDRVHNFGRAPFSVRVEKPLAKVGRGAAGLSPLTAARGTRVTQQVPITNTGNVPITGSLTAEVWLSTHGTLTGATRLATLDNLRISLPPQASRKLAFSFTLPKTLPDTLTTDVPYNLILKVKKVHSNTDNTLLNHGILHAGKITIK